jgi:ATP/maltotriose-dependent transcriptional regulator MalT
MLGDSLTGACMAATYAGDYDAALAYYRETLTICDQIDSVWAQAGARHNIGFVLSDRGDIGEALAVMETSIQLSEQVGFLSPLIIVRADLATLYGALGALGCAVSLAELAVQVAEQKMPIFRVYALAVLCQLRLRQGDVTGAEAVVAQMKSDPHPQGVGFFPVLTLLAEAAVRLAQGQLEQAAELAATAAAETQRLQTRPYHIDALTLQGAALLALEQTAAASQAWRAARLLAETLGARQRLWPVLIRLSQLAADPIEAGQLRQQAQEIIFYIAKQTPPDLRTAFLGSSPSAPAYGNDSTCSVSGGK